MYPEELYSVCLIDNESKRTLKVCGGKDDLLVKTHEFWEALVGLTHYEFEDPDDLEVKIIVTKCKSTLKEKALILEKMLQKYGCFESVRLDCRIRKHRDLMPDLRIFFEKGRFVSAYEEDLWGGLASWFRDPQYFN